jgi:hypothetical protein
MLDISIFNSSFDGKKHYSDNIKKYISSRLDYFHLPNLIIISGDIATGKSTFMKELTKNNHYHLIEREKDFHEAIERTKNDTLCIDLINSHELENILIYLSDMRNKIIITTISYDDLFNRKNWTSFIESQMTRAKMRNAPVHLKWTRANVIAESIF